VARDDRTAAPAKAPPTRALAIVYGLAIVVGLFLGVSGNAPFADRLRHSTSTAAARVGAALGETRPPLDAADWAKLEDDLAALRAAYAGDKEAFDLVAALRGLTSRGEIDWAFAEQSCRALHFPRCDRPALEELRRRSRP
jgi:hypothetical protein